MRDNAVICDDKLKESAVLDNNCVTYDKQSQSTYAGLCFYNCQNPNLDKIMDYDLPLQRLYDDSRVHYGHGQ